MPGIEQILADFAKLKAACNELEQSKVLVGITGGGEDARIAHYHEYGVPGKLPERSFIRASFDSDVDEVASISGDEIGNVLDGNKSAAAAMDSIGARCAQLVQNFIDENRVTPPSDFSRKTQHTTLYETGTHIRDRISYEVVSS